MSEASPNRSAKNILLAAVITLLLLPLSALRADDGYRLWLRASTGAGAQVVANAQSATIDIARQELQTHWRGAPVALNILSTEALAALSADGFTITGNRSTQVQINASAEQGLLYGAYHLLRLQETNTLPETFDIAEKPSYRHRILFDWNSGQNFAGGSIWRWNDLPDILSPRYADLARANASVGINGLNVQTISGQNFNAAFYAKLKALADVMRPYYVKLYVIIPFDVPKTSGDLNTYDPLNQQVRNWWKNKMNDLYAYIPDMGGIVMKANSEGMKGPKDYGRTHADGANMLAEALAPHNGIVAWRAFVYDATDQDRMKEAYEELKPCDGKFSANVLVEVKNGPFDFQPREPFTPLFGAMQQTPVMPELEITQEYMGGSDDLVYLGTMWEEFFQSDTYALGAGSTVARATDGSMFNHALSAIIAIGNYGNDMNWCGHHFAQANWYAYGRMAWNNRLTAQNIAREWLAQTFTTDSRFIEPALDMMMRSHEAIVDYQMPLGLNGLFLFGDHTAPAPGDVSNPRPDWQAPYYHRADYGGVGFDRTTATGTNATAQYYEPLRTQFNSPTLCDDRYLLWFHHLPWTFRTKSGLTLWEELCRHYSRGVREVAEFQTVWETLRPYVDAERHHHVRLRLRKQYYNAVKWKDTCLNYFRQFSQMPIPAGTSAVGRESALSNCYNTGSIAATGAGAAGGIVGAVHENTLVSNGYYLRTAIAGTPNPYGDGRSTSDMQAAAFVGLLNSGNLAGNDVWLAGDAGNDRYPVLKNRASTGVTSPSTGNRQEPWVYYSPSDESLHIAGDPATARAVTVYSLLGKPLLHVNNAGPALSLHTLPAGAYIVALRSGTKHQTVNILKIR
jgi:alpha-glucuronidase